MRKISTLQRSLVRIALFGFVTLFSFQANSQCIRSANACDPTLTANTEDFNDGANGFTGSVNGFTYVPFVANPLNPLTGNFTAVALAGTSYSITTPDFAGTSPAIIGFTLGGTAAIGSYSIEVRNATTDALIGTACSFGGINATGNAVGAECVTITNSDIQSAGSVYFVITFNTRNAQQGGAGTLTFDDFRTNLGEAGTLPVTFTSIDAKAIAGGTQITWKVADQVDVKHYDVERSNDGVRYAKIGSVPAAHVTTYNFTDRQPVSGTVYYRVKNVDVDGRFKYSTIVLLRNGQSTVVLKAFPLPAKNNVTLQHATANSNTRIRISTQEGRLLQVLRPAPGTMQTDINLSAYAPGLYLLSFDDGSGQPETLKLVKQ